MFNLTMTQKSYLNALERTFKNHGKTVTVIGNCLIVNSMVFTILGGGAIEFNKTSIGISDAVKIVMG